MSFFSSNDGESEVYEAEDDNSCGGIGDGHQIDYGDEDDENFENNSTDSKYQQFNDTDDNDNYFSLSAGTEVDEDFNESSGYGNKGRQVRENKMIH